VIGIVAAGALIGARSRRTEVATADPQPTVGAPAEKPAPTRGSETKKSATPIAAAAVVAIKTPAPEAAAPRKPLGLATSDRTEAANPPATESAARAAAGNSTSTARADFEKTARDDSEKTAGADFEKTASVTISGCLELNDTTFRLKDTSGSDAPKSRSWKSGFLRKRSSPIALVDAANTLKLSSHVGQRISATGALVNGEMRARSLESLSPSCR
jgi:hypothetical protein